MIFYNVHDLLHDLVIDISREHKCEFHLPLQEISCRRLLLGKRGITNDAISGGSVHCQRFLRNLSFSQNPGIRSIPEYLFDRLKVLRVLDLSSTAISTLPECVGKMKLLQVLNLSQTEIEEVRDCVRRLKSLQFLDVSRCTSLLHLPDWIGELQFLSHLDVSGCFDIHRNMPMEISKLFSLRTLRSQPSPLSIEENEILNIKDVGHLINLEEICFSLEDERALRSLEDGVLQPLVKMRILLVQNKIPAKEGDIEESNLPVFPEKMNVMKDLQQLFLARFSVPSWICSMINLTELSLSECSDYPSLQIMPNLQTLFLGMDSRCRELPKKFGESGRFRKLVRLCIGGFPLLEEGAMQCLEYLEICECPRLKKVPEGLLRLRRLKKIQVEASDELEKKLEKGGEDWNKIRANNVNIIIDVY